jgi:hypothetical protein
MRSATLSRPGTEDPASPGRLGPMLDAGRKPFGWAEPAYTARPVGSFAQQRWLRFAGITTLARAAGETFTGQWLN